MPKRRPLFDSPNWIYSRTPSARLICQQRLLLIQLSAACTFFVWNTRWHQREHRPSWSVKHISSFSHVPLCSLCFSWRAGGGDPQLRPWYLHIRTRRRLPTTQRKTQSGNWHLIPYEPPYWGLIFIYTAKMAKFVRNFAFFGTKKSIYNWKGRLVYWY